MTEAPSTNNASARDGHDPLQKRVEEGPKGGAKTWYDVLEVAADVSPTDLKKAYDRALALVEGRSIGGYLMLDPLAAESARADVEAAYKVLGDPEKRAAYDAKLRASGETVPGFSSANDKNPTLVDDADKNPPIEAIDKSFEPTATNVEKHPRGNRSMDSLPEARSEDVLDAAPVDDSEANAKTTNENANTRAKDANASAKDANASAKDANANAKDANASSSNAKGANARAKDANASAKDANAKDANANASSSNANASSSNTNAKDANASAKDANTNAKEGTSSGARATGSSGAPAEKREQPEKGKGARDGREGKESKESKESRESRESRETREAREMLAMSDAQQQARPPVKPSPTSSPGLKFLAPADAPASSSPPSSASASKPPSSTSTSSPPKKIIMTAPVEEEVSDVFKTLPPHLRVPPPASAPASAPSAPPIKTVNVGRIDATGKIESSGPGTSNHTTIPSTTVPPASADKAGPTLPESGEIGGALIREIREARGLTLDELAEATKVRKPYLKAIEEEDIPNLPARVYLRGFLTQVGRVLRVDRARLADGYVMFVERSSKTA